MAGAFSALPAGAEPFEANPNAAASDTDYAAGKQALEKKNWAEAAKRFQQAAVRAIRSSNPFPPLPDEFAKQSLEFSVDLMEKE